jgi:hypothetical protein
VFSGDAKSEKMMRLPICAGLLGFILPVGMVLIPGAGAGSMATPDGGTVRSGWGAPDTTEYYVRVLWWGESGTGPGQFDLPLGMGSDRHGNVYVCDRQNNRVQKFDSLGNFLMMFGEEGSQPGQLEGPLDVAVGEDGSIYVTDFDASAWNPSWVHKFDSLGNFILRWGGDSGLEPGQLDAPSGIALGDSGYVYVAEWAGPGRIQRFTSEGEFSLFWRHANPAVYGGDVVGAYPGSVYTRWGVAGYQLFRYDPVGNPIIAFGGETWAQDMATDSEGNLYVTHWGPNGRVSKYDSLGTLVTWWATLQEVFGIAVDAHDAVYVAHLTKDVITKWERRMVGVGEDSCIASREAFGLRLAQNCPNPFSLTTTITYSVEAPGPASLAIYDLRGALVRTLVSGEASPGAHRVVWDGADSRGSRVASGVYFCLLSADGSTETRPMVLLR